MLVYAIIFVWVYCLLIVLVRCLIVVCLVGCVFCVYWFGYFDLFVGCR